MLHELQPILRLVIRLCVVGHDRVSLRLSHFSAMRKTKKTRNAKRNAGERTVVVKRRFGFIDPHAWHFRCFIVCQVLLRQRENRTKTSSSLLRPTR
jgi:hypothetical protein